MPNGAQGHASSDTDLTKKNTTVFFWLALIAIFLITGTIGHDPWWKKGEAYSFGIIHHYYKTGTWLIPTNAGVPFMEKPPLYYWTAHVMCKLFGSFLPLHDAARLATVFYMAATTLFIWLTSRVLFSVPPERKYQMGWICVWLFLGTYGVTLFCHAMITDLALMTGATITLYGLAFLCKLPEKWKHAGFYLGTGMGIIFLSKGFVAPTVFGLSGIVFILLRHIRLEEITVKALMLSITVAAPFFIIWPLLVHQESPALFMEWFWDNNVGRFLGFSVDKLGAAIRRDNFLLMLPVFAFPIFPLACVEIYYARREALKSEYLLPLVVSLVGLVILFASASFRTVYFLLLFPSFTFLAAQGLIRLTPTFFTYWNRMARAAFSITALGTWVIWWNLLQPIGQRPIPWLVRSFDHIFPPDFVLQGDQYFSIATTIIITLFWLYSFRLRGNSAFDTARILFTGAALIWCTTHTILMPWLNETKSFRSTVKKLEEFVATTSYKGQCIANYQLGENMGPLLTYFMNSEKPLPVIDLLGKSPCPLIITFALKDDPENINPHWRMIWRGTRLLDIKSNELRLYEVIK